MHTLRQDLEALTKLNSYRDRAIALRDKGFAGLNAIADLRPDKQSKPATITWRTLPPEKQLGSLDKWLSMGNKIETALLMRIQRHPARDSRDLNPRVTHSQVDAIVDSDLRLAKTIEEIDIDNLVPTTDESEPGNDYEKLDRRIPVLVAANAMHVLTRRASTAQSAQTMYCYYAILQELNLAMSHDWTIGAARAGEGRNVSSFVTGECMRAIYALVRVYRRTAQFLARTRELNEKYLTLQRVIVSVRGPDPLAPDLAPDHPLQLWVDKAIERMWLDWFVSTHPGDGEICFPMPRVSCRDATFATVQNYLHDLPEHLRSGIDEIVRQTYSAYVVINTHTGKVRPNQAPEGAGKVRPNQAPEVTGKVRPNQAPEGTEMPSWRATKNAREHAVSMIDDAVNKARELSQTLKQFSPKAGNDDHLELLETLEKQFNAIAGSIHRSPSTRYLEGALGRAIADSEAQLDAGELVFAACSYGAATNWHSSSRPYLRRACGILLKSVPEDGMLATRRPFHSTPRGYKLFPTSCEMVRSLAELIDKTSYDLDEAAVLALGRLLDAIDDRKLDLDNDRWYGWNFDGAIEQDRPSVWVSCVTVLSLDRFVRMLDGRINDMVLRHFDVIRPQKSQGQVGLNDLIYSDYGFTFGCPSFDGRSKRTPIAIRLEEMRAHLMRVPLEESPLRSTAFSAVLYGPPQTGKTTLAEALALSSGAPLVRLSSFDLTQDPEESIESRGRVIFDALSMLTNAVILFDEFESVLPDRDEKHERSLEFLLTGLLPKLVKLHNLAKSQALVFFLATNYIGRIDSAAIRRGRFDLQLPVYNPDPLSRAATCLYRLQIFRTRARQWPDMTGVRWTVEKWHLDAHAVIRLLNIVRATIDVPPNELAERFFPLPKEKPLDLRDRKHDGGVHDAAFAAKDEKIPGWMTSVPYFAHILEGYKAADMPPQQPDAKEETAPGSPSRWLREEEWLKGFEYSFQQRLREEMERLAGRVDDAHTPEISPVAILEACLRPPSGTTH